MTTFVGCLDIQSNPRGRIPAKDALDAACLPGADAMFGTPPALHE